MAELKIKAESRSQHCEICHQADYFDATNNFCSRCTVIANKIHRQVKIRNINKRVVNSSIKLLYGLITSVAGGLTIAMFIGIVIQIIGLILGLNVDQVQSLNYIIFITIWFIAGVKISGIVYRKSNYRAIKRTFLYMLLIAAIITTTWTIIWGVLGHIQFGFVAKLGVIIGICTGAFLSLIKLEEIDNLGTDKK